MKRTLVFLLASVCSFITASAVADDGMNEIGLAFVKAFKANDLDGVVALYAPDALSFPPDSMNAMGRDEIRASWGGLLNNFDVQDVIITNAHHQTSGDLSSAWGNFKMILISRQDGSELVLEGRFTDVAKKINGQWLYLNDHASMPLPPPPADEDSEG